MNALIFRKNSKKAVTPVIATIILIAATIVLALVVGAYTFGLFGSNVKQITTPSVALYSGNTQALNASACKTVNEAYLSVSFNNPGGATTVSSVIISGGGASAGTVGLMTVATTCATSGGAVGATGSSVLSIYISSAAGTASLASGNTYNYVINFANAQSVSGSLIAY